jgi:Lysozyme like domain
MVALSTVELYALARRAGFSGEADEAVIATAIALAESSGNPDAHNNNRATGDDSFGLWQINMIGKLGPERRRQFGISRNEELLDPLTNARAAHSVFSSPPGGFPQWSTFKRGEHKAHLERARQAAEQFASSRGGVPGSEDLDVTAVDLRRIVCEEATTVLDGQAKRVRGIVSWERYLEVLLDAARKH